MPLPLPSSQQGFLLAGTTVTPTAGLCFSIRLIRDRLERGAPHCGHREISFNFLAAPLSPQKEERRGEERGRRPSVKRVKRRGEQRDNAKPPATPAPTTPTTAPAARRECENQLPSPPALPLTFPRLTFARSRRWRGDRSRGGCAARDLSLN